MTHAKFWMFPLLLASGAGLAAEPVWQPVVEVEDEVYRYQAADNGAGPMWCSGSTCLVRVGERVFTSGLETLPEFPPLNNCRWQLWERAGAGWQLRQRDERGRTREPCPLAAFHDGRVFLSGNPTLTGPEKPAGPARPEILMFQADQPQAPPERLLPGWAGEPPFSEHSYRSFAADGARGELILFQNIGYTHAEWAFRDAAGAWSAQGRLVWPWGGDYEKPQPIRVCYPNVMLKDRAVYLCGVSDIVEPNPAWREHKKQLTGREWDYDFRRLFFTWSDDVTGGEFHPWVEIASREATGGWIFPADLWVGPDGSVHLLWNERAIDVRLRERFFPDARQSQALNYAVVRQGQVVARQTLELAEEGGSELVAGGARFHVTPDNRLLVVYFLSGRDSAGRTIRENRLREITDGASGPAVALPLERPFSQFFTTTVRGGSKPSLLLELLGTPADGSSRVIRYARIRLQAG